MIRSQALFLALLFTLLQACGGGGSSSGNTVTPASEALASTSSSLANQSSPQSSSSFAASANSQPNLSSSSSSAAIIQISSSSSSSIESSSSVPSNISSSFTSSALSSSPSSSPNSSASSSTRSSSANKVQFKSEYSNLCLAPEKETATVGSAIVQTDCSELRTNWEIKPSYAEWYEIVSEANNLCLGRADATSDALKVTACDTTNVWRFNLVSKIDLLSSTTINGTYEIRSLSKCVAIHEKSTAAEVHTMQTECSRDSSQRWRLLGKLPDTTAKTELNLLVITKPESKIPGMIERTTTPEVREKQRFWSETALPRYFHDYTNGRVKLNVYYYESPYLLTKLADKYSVNAQDIPEDLDLVVNPGWFDGVFINHAAPVAGGLVTFGALVDGFYTGFSNVPIDDSSPLFFTNDIAELGATIHEFSHQLEYYYSIVPERRKLTDACAPINNSMLDCGANEPQGGNYTENTDGLGTWLAFYRDFLNGYLWQGKGGLGDAAWSSNHKPREYNPDYVPGGPFSPFANQSTCLNLNSFSTKYIADLSGNNNYATINNANKSVNTTGESFLFDGVDDYFRISNLVGDNFTISLWLKSSQVFPSVGIDGISLIYAGADDGNGFELRGFRNQNDIDTVKFISGNYSAIVSTSDITTNSWVHIAVSRNQTTGIATLYINGKKEAEGNAGTQRLNKNPLIKIGSAFQYPKIGQSIFNNDHLKGEMADFCVLNNVLNATEIAELAKSRKAQSSTIGKHVYLSDMPLFSGATGWGTIGLDKALTGNSIILDGVAYNKGLGVHAPSKLVYHLDKKATRFISDIGIDDEASILSSSAEFKVYGDNKLLYRSASKFDTDKVESINIDISDVDELTLITTEGDNRSNYADITDWGSAQIILK